MRSNKTEQNRAARISLPVLFIALLLNSCAADSADPGPGLRASSPSPSAKPSVNLGAPVASSVEGVPIPASATPKGTPTATDATYYLPESVTLEDLSAWYDEHLPRGADWQGWSWCQESHEVGEHFGFQRLYVRKGTASILAVVLGRGGGAEPTFMNIGTDESGPCT